MNKTIIIGFLGKDPEMRYTPQGKAVTSFSVAVSRKFTSASGEKVQETLWFKVAAWEQKAELCNQYLKKGSRVMCAGRLTGDPTTGGPKLWSRQDGSAGANFEMTLEEIEFLGEPKESAGQRIGEAEQMPMSGELPPEDAIPF
jgi:single-strand DNA-binding protein